jgi:UDP-GlcNAc:undecaprenyl-phosphate GlcNAc-1-phosphate transferase
MFFLSALCVAFVASIFSIKVLLPLAPQIGLIDYPTDRKNHDGAIPLIGGISIFTGVLIASTLFVQQSQLLNLYLISSSILVFIGTLDDIYDLRVAPRMLAQALIASIMVFGGGIYISDFGNLFGLGDVELGYFGIIFTMLAAIAAINAFNMIDGIDGLAGSMSIISVLSVAILTLLAGGEREILLPLILVVATIPYLFYNVKRRKKKGRKIFMGDAGSMFMGLTIIWLLTLGTQSTELQTAAFRPVTALWIIAIPLIDMLAIMLRRIKKGVSPFQADNGHLHHICMRLGLCCRQSLLTITLLAIVCSTIGILGEVYQVPEVIMLSIFVIFFIVYSFALQHIWKITKVLKAD